MLQLRHLCYMGETQGLTSKTAPRSINLLIPTSASDALREPLPLLSLSQAAPALKSSYCWVAPGNPKTPLFTPNSREGIQPATQSGTYLMQWTIDHRLPLQWIASVWAEWTVIRWVTWDWSHKLLLQVGCTSARPTCSRFIPALCAHWGGSD